MDREDVEIEDVSTVEIYIVERDQNKIYRCYALRNSNMLRIAKRDFVTVSISYIACFSILFDRASTKSLLVKFQLHL